MTILSSYDIVGEAYHQTTGDVTFLKEMVARLPQNPIIINIGACFGTSALAMIEARPDAFIFSIDIAPSPKEEDNLKLAGVWDWHRVVRILGASQDVGQQWPIKTDLVYVDGAHGYQDAFDDIVIWRKTIKPGGFMVIHDYDKPICKEVKPAVDAAMAGYDVFARQESMIAFKL